MKGLYVLAGTAFVILEAKPKDLAIEWEVSLARGPDPSLRSG